MEESTDEKKEEQNQEDEKQFETKEDKIEKERQTLINKVVSGKINNIQERVAFVLNNFKTARNSDVDLAWLYWTTFEEEFFNGVSVTKKEMMELTRIPSLVRARAKIQNDYKLFQADDKIKKRRGKLAQEKKEEVIEDTAGIGGYSVYIDETGKTQDYLSIGSLWILEGRQSFPAFAQIKRWKKENNIDFEFHFSELRNHKLEYYKNFFTRFLSLHPGIGFKLITIDKKGFKDINRTITDLTFHLINKGIDHENSSGRAPLPRLLQIWLDEDEKGSDRLKLENIKERLIGQKIDGLYIGNFEVVDSKESIYIQAVDLFTASVNRKLHNPDGGNKAKDILAEYILQSINFDVSQIDKKNKKVDSSKVFNLRAEN